MVFVWIVFMEFIFKLYSSNPSITGFKVKPFITLPLKSITLFVILWIAVNPTTPNALNSAFTLSIPFPSLLTFTSFIVLSNSFISFLLFLKEKALSNTFISFNVSEIPFLNPSLLKSNSTVLFSTLELITRHLFL